VPAGPPPRADLPLPARRGAQAGDGALRETSSSTCPDVWEPIDVAPVARVTPHPGQGTGPPRLGRHPRATTLATATPGGGCPPAGASYHGSRAGVAQSAEHSPCKRKVRGSIPRAGSRSARVRLPNHDRDVATGGAAPSTQGSWARRTAAEVKPRPDRTRPASRRTGTSGLGVTSASDEPRGAGPALRAALMRRRRRTTGTGRRRSRGVRSPPLRTTRRTGRRVG
jgi:hypothetical protein